MTSGDESGDEAVGEAGDGSGESGEEHRPDGLDLARQSRRAAGAQPGTPAQRRTTRTGATRGRPAYRSSGARPDDRDPQLLEAEMSRLVSKQGWELDLRVQQVFGRWGELVGEDVGAHCTPESFADTRLVVRTDSTAWATQLKLLAPTILTRLNAELGAGTITLIEVLGPHLPSWKKGRYGVRDGRGPRDTYG